MPVFLASVWNYYSALIVHSSIIISVKVEPFYKGEEVFSLILIFLLTNGFTWQPSLSPFAPHNNNCYFVYSKNKLTRQTSSNLIIEHMFHIDVCKYPLTRIVGALRPYRNIQSTLGWERKMIIRTSLHSPIHNLIRHLIADR